MKMWGGVGRIGQNKCPIPKKERAIIEFYDNLRHCVEFLCKTGLLVGSRVLFQNSFGYRTVDNRANFGEKSGGSCFVAGSDYCKEFLDFVLNLGLYDLVLCGFLFGN